MRNEELFILPVGLFFNAFHIGGCGDIYSIKTFAIIMQNN